MEIPEILRKFKIIAVVGCSRDPLKPSNNVPAFLKEEGFTIIPVNPSADVILDEKCYKSLLDIDREVEIVEVFRPSTEALEVTKQAVQIKAKVVWLQEGIVNDEAKAYAEQHGLGFVQDKCMMKEYAKIS